MNRAKTASVARMQARWKSGLDFISCSPLLRSVVLYSILDGCGCNTGQFVATKGGFCSGYFLDFVEDGLADQIRAGLEKLSTQGLGISIDHGNGKAGLGTFKIVLHLDGDADFCKFVHAAQLLLLSDGVLVGLTPGGEVDGVAGNFDLDLVHCGTVGEPGGGQDGGGDEREGEDDADDGVHFHGGDFLSLALLAEQWIKPVLFRLGN